MALPTTVNGSKLLIQLESDDSPNVFTAPCGLTTTGFNLTASANEFNVPDCDDPDDPMFTKRVISALSAGVTGSGTLAMESFETWRTWMLSGQPKNIRIVFDVTPDGGYYEMSAVLTTFNQSGEIGALVNAEVEIQSNGLITWVPAI